MTICEPIASARAISTICLSPTERSLLLPWAYVGTERLKMTSCLAICGLLSTMNGNVGFVNR